MNLIDTHCHLNFDSFDTDRDKVIARAKAAGITKMVSIGCRLADAQKTLEIVNTNQEIFAAIGMHPGDIDENFSEDFDTLASLATNRKVVAIGETGLDFFRPENPPKALQIMSFERHFQLAQRLEKPLIIHSRTAKEQTLEFLKTLNGHPFVWHCFSEDMSCAEQILELGGMISFTGIVTFPGRNTPRCAPTEIQNVAKNTPLESIMVETDAPFLAPVPYRSKRCEPAFVVATARFIAELREMDIEEFSKVTTRNAEKFFGI